MLKKNQLLLKHNLKTISKQKRSKITITGEKKLKLVFY